MSGEVKIDWFEPMYKLYENNQFLYHTKWQNTKASELQLLFSPYHNWAGCRRWTSAWALALSTPFSAQFSHIRQVRTTKERHIREKECVSRQEWLLFRAALSFAHSRSPESKLRHRGLPSAPFTHFSRSSHATPRTRDTRLVNLAAALFTPI